MSNAKKNAGTKKNAKSGKPDKALFSGFSETNAPVQKVVPIDEKEVENSKELVMMSLQVPKNQKRQWSIYTAMTGLSLKELLTKGANEFIKNHPAN